MNRRGGSGQKVRVASAPKAALSLYPSLTLESWHQPPPYPGFFSDGAIQRWRGERISDFRPLLEMGMLSKQPLPGMGIHIFHPDGLAYAEQNSFNQLLSQIYLREGLLFCRSHLHPGT